MRRRKPGIIDEALLDEFRRGPCEWCGRPGRTEAAHVIGKGIGCGRRFDVRINLAALCRLCHQSHHDGKPPTAADLTALVAWREKVSVEYIEKTMLELRRRHPNDPKRGEL